MSTQTRSEFVPMDFLDVTFTSQKYPPLGDKVVPVLVHPHTRTFEAYTPNSQGPRNRWKSFEHYRVQRGDSPKFLLPCKLDYSSWEQGVYLGYIPAGTFTVYGWDAFGDPGLPNSGLPGMYVERPDGGFVPPPADLETLERRALKAMLPIIQAELSLVNSLIELRDFRSLPNTLRRVKDVGVRAYSVARELGRKLPPAVKGWRLRDLFGRSSQATADSYLQTQFNLLPLLSDVLGIHRALSRLQRRINELVTREGRHQVKHWVFHWNEFENSSELKADGQWYAADYLQHPPLLYYHIRRTVTHEPTTFHAEVRYNYVYSGYQRALAPLLGLLDSLGVNPNPAIIWNAIPWTFVIDWVFGVSRWLDQFKSTLMEPQINILSYLWSVKRRRVITLSRFTPVQRNSSVLGPEMAMPATFETAYRRQVGSLSMSSIESSGVNSKEFTLGAALVIARRRRRS